MGLDENLPIFVLANSPNGTKHHAAIYHTVFGDEPELYYVVKHGDPALDHSQNCYAAALFDAYTPDILYGEVLLRPEWVQPTVSKEEQRRNGGIPPPPEAVMPTEFTIQLYNPDQQIVVSQKSGGLVGSPRWEFSVPQDVFRAPSGSILDRTQNDPGANASTPRITFAWKRDNKITNTLSCAMTGRSTDVLGKKKNKEPDITIGVYKSLRELTIYEPNLSRLDLQDLKGLEIILLLSSTVIRDVFFTQMKNPFNMTEGGRRRSSTQTSTEASKTTSPPLPTLPPRHGIANAPAAVNGLYAQQPPRKDAVTPSKYHHSPPLHNITNPNAPITDPRTQWEIDAETARLKAKADAEAKELKRKQEANRREQKRLAEEESKRLKKMVEAEEKERLRKQKEVEKETARLKKKYGPQQMPPPPPPSQTKPQQQQQQQQQNYAYPAANGRPMMTPAVGPHATQYQNQPQPPYQPQSQHHNQPSRQQQAPPQIVLPPGGYNYNPQFQQQIPPHFMPPPSNSTIPLQQPKPQHGRRRSFLDLRNFTTSSNNNRSADDLSSVNRTSNIW